MWNNCGNVKRNCIFLILMLKRYLYWGLYGDWDCYDIEVVMWLSDIDWWMNYSCGYLAYPHTYENDYLCYDDMYWLMFFGCSWSPLYLNISLLHWILSDPILILSLFIGNLIISFTYFRKIFLSFQYFFPWT